MDQALESRGRALSQGSAPADKDWNNHTREAKEDFALWVGTKERARLEGRDVNEALLRITKERRSARNNAV